VEPGADDVPVGTINVGADGADPRSGDNAGSPRRDLVVRGTDSCTLRHTTLGDTVLALGSSGAMGPGVVGLLMLGYPDSPFPRHRLWQVENSAEQACSQVEATKRMLHETLATVGRDILHIIRVSLKKVESLPERLWLPLSSLTPPCLCFYNSCPGAHATGGGDPGVGGHHCYGGFCPGGCCSAGECHSSYPRCGGPSCPS
jgi:hypothetical protein